ncbi:hypothetical protein SLE2022_322630 [Rubroshorea leprosula]
MQKREQEQEEYWKEDEANDVCGDDFLVSGVKADRKRTDVDGRGLRTTPIYEPKAFDVITKVWLGQLVMHESDVLRASGRLPQGKG